MRSAQWCCWGWGRRAAASEPPPPWQRERGRPTEPPGPAAASTAGRRGGEREEGRGFVLRDVSVFWFVEWKWVFLRLIREKLNQETLNILRSSNKGLLTIRKSHGAFSHYGPTLYVLLFIWFTNVPCFYCVFRVFTLTVFCILSCSIKRFVTMFWNTSQISTVIINSKQVHLYLFIDLLSEILSHIN